MIVHLRNKTKAKGLMLSSFVDDSIELSDKDDNTVSFMLISDIESISNDNETEFITIQSIENGIEIIHEYDIVNDDGCAMPIEKTHTFKSVESFVDFTFDELVPKRYFWSEPSVF